MRNLIRGLLFGIVLILIYNHFHRRYGVIDPEFRDVYNAFQHEAILHHKSLNYANLTIEMYEPRVQDDVNGYCELSGDSAPPYIAIKRSKWNSVDAYGKEALLFHELGHCILHRDHINGLIRDSNGHLIPQSIMYPYSFASTIYKDYREYYLDELFSVN
jgi:hypothetical protein